MDHVVYLDAKAKELEKIAAGAKTMIVRGAAGRKLPHGRVFPGDTLYFINNNGEGLIRASAKVKTTVHSEKLSEAEALVLLNANQEKLQLSEAQRQRWNGKRFLVLVEINEFTPLQPFPIDKSNYGSMDDWLPVGEIDKVRVVETD
ncbi:MAG TPA: hypothetical protein VHO48_00420 [Anaerolineaceae bacterium]|jgi:hypothetical protein|nr:hypothetical protein [Anaerolineaceae bacterium]